MNVGNIIKKMSDRKKINYKGFTIIAQLYKSENKEDDLKSFFWFCADIPAIEGENRKYHEGVSTKEKAIAKGLSKIDNFIMLTAITENITQDEVVEQFAY